MYISFFFIVKKNVKVTEKSGMSLVKHSLVFSPCLKCVLSDGPESLSERVRAALYWN